VPKDHFDSASLILLDDNKVACSLAVVWPFVAQGGVLWEEWAMLAGVTVSQAKKNGSGLRAVGICVEIEGKRSTDDLALNYIRGITAGKIKCTT